MDFTKNFKSFENCFALMDTIVSGKPNLSNNSCKISIVTLLVGFLHLKTSGHFVKLSITMR